MSDTKFIPNPNVCVTRPHSFTPLRLKGQVGRHLLSKGKGALLVAGLIVAVALFATDGGGTAPYDLLYGRASQAEDYLVGRPGAPLSFLKRNQSIEERFRLQGIVYSRANPIAIVNGKTCASGEVFSVQVRRGNERIQCLEIQPESVMLATPAGSEFALALSNTSD